MENQQELERKAKEFLLAMNFDLKGEMSETPRRMVDLYRDMSKGVKIDIKKFFERPLTVKHNEMTIIKDIEFVSWCCHHLWPFYGTVSIAFVPHDKIVGLSKFISAVRALALRPQIQEQMTSELADAITECLRPMGCMVVVKGIHTCLLVGGKYDYGFPAMTQSKTITSAIRGVFAWHAAPRMEALRLFGGE